MAKFEHVVKVQRGEDVREVGNDADLNSLLWDGFTRVEDIPPVTEEQAEEMSPQKRAAVERQRATAEKQAGVTTASASANGGAPTSS